MALPFSCAPSMDAILAVQVLSGLDHEKCSEAQGRARDRASGATRRILAEMPVMKILALSIYSDDGFNSGMIRDGAMGYIMNGGDSRNCSARSFRMSLKESSMPADCQLPIRNLQHSNAVSTV